MGLRSWRGSQRCFIEQSRRGLLQIPHDPEHREPAEYEIVKIPGSVLIPKGEFLDGSALERMPQDKQIVINCKTGVRSAEVLAVLKGAGFANSVHVGGGISAWVNQIEPHKPSY